MPNAGPPAKSLCLSTVAALVVIAIAAPLLTASSARAASYLDGEVAARRAALHRLAGKPEALVPLLGLLDLWNDVEDRASIAQLLDETIADRSQRADVRARATYLRSIVDDRLGETKAGAARRAPLGLISEWMVLGPFDDEGKTADHTALEPEAELASGALRVDFGKLHPGKDRSVGWRRFPSRSEVQGLVPFDAALRPDAHVTGYATGYVRSDRDQAIAVRSGSTGALSVWLNGKQIIDQPDYRPIRIDQDAAPASLRKGWNRVTVKLGAQDSGWAFLLRLSAPDGGPVAFQQRADLPSDVLDTDVKGKAPKAKPGRRAGAPEIASLGVELKRAADGAGAEAMRAYGLYLHYVAPEDPVRGAAEQLLKTAAMGQPSTEAFRLAAMAASDAEGRRKWLEQALGAELSAKAPAGVHARALVELGEVYARMHRDRRAEELWREAERVDPTYFPAALRLAEQTADRGLPARADTLLEALARDHHTLSIMKAQANLADRRGRRKDAEDRYGALAATTHDDLTALRELYSYARGRGDISAALGLLDKMAAGRPDLSSLIWDRADLLDGVGRSAEAHDALAVVLRDCPDDPRMLERDGRILHRLGRDAEALTAFRRALELRPQNPDLRTYLGQIEKSLDKSTSGLLATTGAATGAGTGKAAGGDGAAREKRGDDLARQFGRPVVDMIAEAKKAAGKTPTGPARVLLDLTATRVHPNGLSESYTERVVEILDERGAREQGSDAIRYTPDTQSVEVKAARVYKKNGDVVDAPAQTDQETSEPWYGLYYDTRAQQITFPRLEPGDVIDLEYVISDVANRNMFADYFGELHAFQEELPRRESEFVLVTPKSRPFYFNKPALAGYSQSDVEQGDERIYRFRAVDVPRIEAEPGMPGFTSVAAYVHVSTYKSWEDVAAWYTGLVRGQLDVDDPIRNEVKRIVAEAEARAQASAKSAAADSPEAKPATRPATKPATKAQPKIELSERMKIRAIYDAVVKQTRYVGLEFGIHGYKPYAVTQVFARKFGDCKDKASLLVAMLRLINVDATLVLARTRHGGDLDPYPASLAPFDHAIVYVPRYDLYLDGTAEFSGSDELPAQDQDIPVLLVSDSRVGGKGHLARTPVLAPDRNHVSRELTVGLAATGSAQVDLKMTVTGEAAHEWRNHYQTPGERRERFEKAENGAHPGAKVTQVEFPSLEDLERPVEVRSKLEVPGWAHADAGNHHLAMPALGREGELLRSYARLSERQHELVLGYPWEQTETIRIAMPAGYAPTRLPEARRIDTPFGSFTVSVERRGMDVLLQSSLTMTRHKIAAAEYPAFRRFCRDVDAAVGQQLVIAHE